MSHLFLNGETTESMAVSLAAILSLPLGELKSRMAKIDSSGLFSEELEQKLAGHFLSSVCLPDFSVVWFHGSRLLRNHTVMSEGLLPHHQAKEQLLPVLKILAEGIERVGGNPFVHSAMSKPTVEGPFGMLFRDAVAQPSGFSGKYIYAPELVDDIAGAMLGANYRALTHRFAEMSESSIVHFIAPPTEAVLPKALRFVYETQVEGIDPVESASSCVTCFDNGGVAISPDRILKIETLVNAGQ